MPFVDGHASKVVYRHKSQAGVEILREFNRGLKISTPYFLLGLLLLGTWSKNNFRQITFEKSMFGSQTLRHILFRL